MQKLKMILPILGLFLSTGFSAPRQLDSLLQQLNHCALAAKSALKGDNSFDEAELAKIEPDLINIEVDMNKEFARLREHDSRSSKSIKTRLSIVCASMKWLVLSYLEELVNLNGVVEQC